MDRRTTITIGNSTEMSRSEASAASAHIDHLFEARDNHFPIQKRTLEWLGTIDQPLRERLVRRGLCEAQFDESRRTISGLCRHYLNWQESRGRAAGSLEVYAHSIRALEHFFGPEKDIVEITPADMDDFFTWIYKKGKQVEGGYGAPLAKTTASRRIQVVKSIFRRAARRQWIRRSSFYDMFESTPRQTRTNSERKYFVPAEVIHKIIEHATCNEQKLVFALARWCGLRIPSELLRITWDDINWSAEKILIRSSDKQKSNAIEKQTRWMPIFPEVRPYLDQAWIEAPPGSLHVIRRYRSKNSSAHATLLKRAAFRAGLTEHRDQLPWDKIWVNQRSTRTTELRIAYPKTPDVVNYWMNHSELISKLHYQQWEDFEWRDAPG